MYKGIAILGVIAVHVFIFPTMQQGETEGSSYTLFSPFARHKDFPEWLDALVKGSAFDSSLPARYYERVLTLSTCTSRSYTERMILHGVLIKELPES